MPLVDATYYRYVSIIGLPQSAFVGLRQSSAFALAFSLLRALSATTRFKWGTT